MSGNLIHLLSAFWHRAWTKFCYFLSLLFWYCNPCRMKCEYNTVVHEFGPWPPVIIIVIITGVSILASQPCSYICYLACSKSRCPKWFCFERLEEVKVRVWVGPWSWNMLHIYCNCLWSWNLYDTCYMYTVTVCRLFCLVLDLQAGLSGL